ncbi:MAG: MBL fold metallo-hydrolase [Thermoplasmata archaeon]|nr:MAG: MBL fold metallo-hydrolase [Thermoplasmata archaeon]RLF66407.1 MAG: MBL fold metallo-hydrolase [Thermoplasmata archaeon]HHD16018.1 MBL fold metallo-hydrolase [Euryarchaeota archaeon]
MEPKIEWLGHASFRISTGKGIIYIDPWKTSGAPKADLILITHSHYDHLSEDDISRLKKANTIIMGTRDVVEKVPEAVAMIPGSKKNISGIKVEAVPAYNPEKQFHPRENNWVGYVIDVDGFRIYHSGDTDVIAEMKELRNIDVALLPVGGTYTMSPEEAAQAVSMFSPRKAIPMHWGDIVGGKKDAKRFKKLASCEVEILEQVS